MEWCGKPHETDDPPCDNCGHHKFERAVEQVTVGDGSEQGPVWACTDCGREHQKHSPPCSRCGNATLEKRQPDYSDLDDLGGTSYLDVLEPKYVAGYAVVALLVAVLMLSTTGVVDVLGVNDGNPTVSNVPGNGTTAAGLSLSEVEAAYVAEMNERRVANGYRELEVDGHVEDVASYYNKKRVKADYADGSTPSERQREESFGDACSNVMYLADLVVHPSELDGESLDGYSSEKALGTALVDQYQRKYADFSSPTRGVIGVDVHVATDGTIYVVQYTC